ncbi:MAG: hypothetical protein LBI15_00100 [Dysgonamonadaceae bacterium]|jgi:uncharacterized protein (TIGR02145 family)|nr:hypothetical protein [Dysgonamonadaceae bacterium]
MKKISFLSICLITTLGISIPTSSYGQGNTTQEEGVVINGVRWATRNVDEPGTFSPTPESKGRLFLRSGSGAFERRTNEISGNQDPCPTGWRLPTDEQFERLNDERKVWTTRGGMNGILYGTAPNQIFLPAVGHRVNQQTEGQRGLYVSGSSIDNSDTFVALSFSSTSSNVGRYGTVSHYVAARCVVDVRTPAMQEIENRRLAQEAERDRPRLESAFNIMRQQEGVMINGVLWATRNVDDVGTFTANPEDAGTFFQWSNWGSANNPCPIGWRVPTREELDGLNNVRNEWISFERVSGRLFGSAPNQIFLPAAGSRNSNGGVESVGRLGLYWSNRQYGSGNAISFGFSSDDRARVSPITPINRAYSLRCVAVVASFEQIEIERRNRELQALELEADKERQREEEARAQEEERKRQEEEARQMREGVMINGVRWANRNVGVFGTFVATPESAGMFYQWNRREIIAGNRSDTGRSWVRENDPCPQGWRIPTNEELQSLVNAGSIWTTRNGVSGRLFGTEPNQIFFPAINSRGDGGAAWSNTRSGRGNAYYLHFTDSNAFVGSISGIGRFSIRCVR